MDREHDCGVFFSSEPHHVGLLQGQGELVRRVLPPDVCLIPLNLPEQTLASTLPVLSPPQS